MFKIRLSSVNLRALTPKYIQVGVEQTMHPEANILKLAHSHLEQTLYSN